MSAPVGVIGTGYVGLVTAAALAQLGNHVVCLDVDAAKVERLRRGEVPIVEPDLPETLARCRERLEFTTDPRDLHPRVAVAFVTVDTPPLPSGDADLSRVEAVLDAVPDTCGPLTLVMKSTVPVGTGARVRRHLDGRGLGHVRYVANPEFLREGRALHDVSRPDRVVVGSDDPGAADAVAALWAPLGGRVIRCDTASAEMIKLASNAYLATRISFVNEIANVCHATGADVDVVTAGMGADRRIGSAFLRPGLGFGGSCFPKDVAALKQLAGNSGYHFQLLASVIEVNELQKRRVVGMLAGRLGPLAGRRVALLGLAFKPGTDDVREATSLVLAARLAAEGVELMVHDPVVGPEVAALLPFGTRRAATAADAVRGADAAVIVTEWPEYGALLGAGVAASMARALVVDGRNMLDPAAAADAGFEWIGIGRPDAGPADRAWGRVG